MGKIYRRATSVVAWVGREEDPGKIVEFMEFRRFLKHERLPCSVSAGFNLVNTLYGTSEKDRYYLTSDLPDSCCSYEFSQKIQQCSSNESGNRILQERMGILDRVLLLELLDSIVENSRACISPGSNGTK